MEGDERLAAMLADFIGITGAEEHLAIDLLKATDNRLDDAVNLFFATHGDGE
jgi:hypothetical protein